MLFFFFPTGHQIAVDPESTHKPLKPIGVEVSGSTMGIIGMGHIGHKIAQRGKGFDMKILYHNRSRRQELMDKMLNLAHFDFLKRRVG